MVTKCKSLFLLLVLFGFDMIVTGQQAERFLEVRGMAELDEKPLGNTTATLYDGNTKVNTVQTGTDGTFSFRLEANKNYTVEVSRNGLVTKKISFNTTLPDEETGKWVSEFGMVMLRPCEGVDYSVLQKPVDIIRFNTRRRSFESDRDYNEQMMPKLQDINIKSANCLEDKYDKLVEKADRLYDQKQYEEARATYLQASEIMPSQSYPQKKASEITTLMEKQKASEEAARIKADQQAQEQARQQAQSEMTVRKEELSKSLDAYLDEGDAQYKAKNYEAARDAYTNALKINPSEPYAKQQLSRIEKLIVSEQTAQQKSAEDDYKDAIDRANAAIAQQQYGLAREQLQKALTIKPGDAFAQARVQEANRLEKEQIKNQTEQDQRNRQYQEAVASADRLLQAKDYQGSLAGFRRALVIKPGDSYALQRIQGIENALAAEQAAREKALAEERAAMEKAEREKVLAEQQAARERALAEEKAAMERAERERALAAEQAAKQKATEEGYNNAMAQGNTALAQNQYGLAREQYLKALGFKPDDVSAKNKISEADRLLKLEQDRLSAEQARKQQYDQNIAQGDRLLLAKDYNGSKLAFQEALRLMPDESYPKQKISEIDKVLADRQQALAAQQAKDRAYNEAVKNGDMYYSLKSYNDARSEYNKALALKPEESYPKGKLAEIEEIVRAEQKALADAKARDESFNTAIEKANAYFAQKQWNPAREQYMQALSFKPGDAYARSRVAEIDLVLKQAQDQLAAEQARKTQYEETLARADKLLAARDYSNSRLSYEEASRLMPGESYPKQKIGEIDKILADQQKALAEKQAKDKAYNEAVKNGDMYFSMKNYTDAKNEYNKALSVKPDESYPRDRISEIDTIIKAEQKALADARAKEEAYKAAVSAGDQAYGQKKYAEAKTSFNQALALKPEDTYAKSQIALIDNILAEAERQRKAEEARQKQYNDIIALADKAFDAANYPAAKDQYQKALAVIPDSPYPKQRIARIDEINRLLAQQQSAARQSARQSISSAAPLTQLNFKNDAERDIYLSDLKRKYPEGVTLEIYGEKYQEIRRYIIVRDDVASEFRDVKILSYGGHEYSKDGRTVTQMYFEQQVKSRQGEYYNEITFE